MDSRRNSDEYRISPHTSHASREEQPRIGWRTNDTARNRGLIVSTTELANAFREMRPKTLCYAYPCALNPFSGDFQGKALDNCFESKIE